MEIWQIVAWLAVGLIPYDSKQQWLRGRRSLEVRALFWSLTITWRTRRRRDWRLRIPLIERVRDAVWAAVMRLKAGDEGKDSQTQ